jgi:hypothetical protein
MMEVNMLILKLPMLDHYIYINASKILWFESTPTGCTELHLDSGESHLLAITPEELCHFMNEPLEESKMLTSSDLQSIFR